MGGTLLPLLIIIISLGIIIVIIIRKFPTLASIDISELPSEQQSKLKRSLLENRLSRKLSERMEQISLLILPAIRVIKKGIIALYKKLRELEKEYRLKRKSGHLPDSPNQAEIDILAEARDYFEQNKFTEAEEAYIAIINHNPRQVEGYEGLVEVYLAQKDYQHAQETLNFLLKLKEDKITSNEKVFEKKMELPSSEQHELAVHHFELGEVYKRNGELDKALRSFKEAVKLDPNNPKYLDSLIEMSILQGNKLLSERTLNKLKLVNPDNSKIREWQKRIGDM